MTLEKIERRSRSGLRAWASSRFLRYHGRQHMDIVSHGLWGSLAFGRKSRQSFWLAFLFGVCPDLLAFGPFLFLTFLGLEQRPRFAEPPDPNIFPAFVHQTYNVTHSLIIFAILFGVLWLIFRRPIWEFSAWALHILVDIPTHSYRFFPTPFLWPVSNFRVDGHPWATPEIFIPDVISLVILYAWFFSRRPWKS